MVRRYIFDWKMMKTRECIRLNLHAESNVLHLRFHFFHIFMLKESLVHMQRWEHQFRNVELFHACGVIIGLLRTVQLTGQMQLELILEMNAGIMIFYRINKSDTQLLEDVISRMLVFAELQDYLQSMCL